MKHFLGRSTPVPELSLRLLSFVYGLTFSVLRENNNKQRHSDFLSKNSLNEKLLNIQWYDLAKNIMWHN